MRIRILGRNFLQAPTSKMVTMVMAMAMVMVMLMGAPLPAKSHHFHTQPFPT